MWNWVQSEWRMLVPLGMGWLAICWALPQDGRRSRWLPGLLGLAALVLFCVYHFRPGRDIVREVLFYVFSGTAVISAALMITDRNPVYAALWFAVTTLGVCGLFLLNAAPFLAAATIVVYAGAIIVTFLFVIMLAQQAGATNYDRRAYQPAAASATAFLLFGCLLYVLQGWSLIENSPTPILPDPTLAATRLKFMHPPAAAQANELSKPIGEELGTMRNLGRSLFTDYLYAVEIAGTVLLIATIGAIAIAPRRSQGTF